MAGARDLTAHVYIKGHDQTSSVFTGIAGNVSKFTNGLNVAGRKMKNVGRVMGSNYALPMAAIIGVAGKQAYAFQEAMNQVSATTLSSEAKIKKYTEAIREFGLTTRYTAEGSAKAYNEIVKAGNELDDSLALLPITLNLAASGAMGLETAAKLSMGAMNGFGLVSESVVETQEKLAHLNDVTAYTATKSATSVLELMNAYQKAGPITNAIGMEFEKTAAILGAFANGNIVGAESGRGFSTGLLRLLAPTKQARAAIAGLNIDMTKYLNTSSEMTGIKLSDSLKSNAIKIDADILQNVIDNAASGDLLGDIVDKIIDKGGDNSTEARLKISQMVSEIIGSAVNGVDLMGFFDELRNKNASAAEYSSIFGKIHAPKYMALVNLNEKKGYRKLYEDIKKNADDVGKIMAEIQMRGAVGAVRRFESAVEGINLSVWDSGLADQMTNGLIGITEAIRGLTDSDVELLGDVAKTVGLFVLTGSTLNLLGRTVTGFSGLATGLGKLGIAAASFAAANPVVAATLVATAVATYVMSMDDEGEASEYAAESIKKHVEQLEIVESLLGSVSGKAGEYAKNLNASTNYKLGLSIAEDNEALKGSRAEIILNLKSTNDRFTFFTTAEKKRLDKLRVGFEVGSLSLKKLVGSLYSIASKNNEYAQAAEVVINNVKGHATRKVGRDTNVAIRKYGSISNEAAKEIAKLAVSTVSIKDHVSINTILGKIKDLNTLIFTNIGQQQSIYPSPGKNLDVPLKELFLGTINDRNLRIDGFKSERQILQSRYDDIFTEIKQKNEAILQQIREPSKLEGHADVNINVKVDGSNGGYQSSSVVNSGHIKAKVNVGTSTAWVEH